MIVEGPHKGRVVQGDVIAPRYVAEIESRTEGGKFAHYEMTPYGYRLQGISASPTTLRTER